MLNTWDDELPGGPIVKPSGDGAVSVAAMGMTDSEDGIDEPTSVRPTPINFQRNMI